MRHLITGRKFKERKRRAAEEAADSYGSRDASLTVKCGGDRRRRFDGALSPFLPSHLLVRVHPVARAISASLPVSPSRFGFFLLSTNEEINVINSPTGNASIIVKANLIKGFLYISINF